VCHDPHGGRFPGQLRAGLNALCLQCHYDAPAAGPSPDDPALLFDRRAPDTERTMVKAGTRIELHGEQTVGHPSYSHPVAGRPNPADRGRPLTCASCHQPHGAPSRQLFRFNARSVSALCVGCHKLSPDEYFR
jgi:predicted CXXCH cytochrome family protein